MRAFIIRRVCSGMTNTNERWNCEACYPLSLARLAPMKGQVPVPPSLLVTVTISFCNRRKRIKAQKPLGGTWAVMRALGYFFMKEREDRC